MPETQSKPAGQPQQDKEERGKVTVDLPISAVEATMAGLGFGGEEGEREVNEPALLKEQEQLFADAHPDDVAAIEERMGAAPEGAKIPDSARSMPSRYGAKNVSRSLQGSGEVPGRPERPALPAGQEGIPKFTGGEGGLPSQREAFEYSMRTPPKVQTKKDFMAGQKSPEWWKIMLRDFAGGAPGAGRAEWEAKADEMYQQAIQGQMQDKAEFERKQGLVSQFAVKPEDEMVTFKFGDREITVQRKNTGQLAALFGKEYDIATDKNKQVSLRTLLPNDPNAPDWHLPREEALAYAKFFTDQTNMGLGTGRDLLRTINPELWQFLEDHELSQAKELARTKKDIQDEVTQRAPTQRELALEADAMTQPDEYGNPTQLTPDLSKYVKSISHGQSVQVTNKDGSTTTIKGSESISNEDMAGYAENVQMMNHVNYKNNKGDTTWAHDYWVDRLKEKGWYFMGERIPNDKKKAAAQLRRLRNAGKVNQVQSASFMLTHFGDFMDDFNIQAPANFFFDEESLKMEKSAGVDVGSGYEGGVGGALEQIEKLQPEGDELPPLDPETQIGEKEAREYMGERGLQGVEGWKKVVERFKANGIEVVMGR